MLLDCFSVPPETSSPMTAPRAPNTSRISTPTVNRTRLSLHIDARIASGIFWFGVGTIIGCLSFTSVATMGVVSAIRFESDCGGDGEASDDAAS